jgi:microcystin degradation protein MlrC
VIEGVEQLTGAPVTATDLRAGANLICAAMVAEGEPDVEGSILEAIRTRIGRDVPLVVTLDLHANVTKQMADNASALIAFRTYPHVDQYERAWQGAEEKLFLTIFARHPHLPLSSEY